MRLVVAAILVLEGAPFAAAQTPQAWQQAYADQQMAARLQYQAQALSNRYGIRVQPPAMGYQYGAPAYGNLMNRGTDQAYAYPSYALPAVESPGAWAGPRAENGDLWNVDNDFDGRREPNPVRGYWRTDGTYTRGHYRAPARR